ncbi:MAG: MFS transporter [Promethearchaeota archaeon]
MKERKGAPKKTMKLLKNNLKILFKSSNRKGFIAILITSFIISFNYITKSLLESYLTSSPYITQDDATIIILIISLATFIGYIFTGIVADKLGRKLIFYMYALIQPISVIIIVIGTYIPINTLIIVSVGGGFAYITSQCLVVVIRIVTLEILPTEARGIGTGVKSLVAAIGMTAGMLLSSPFILNLGLGITFIIFSIPYIIIIPLIYYNLKETKGIDLSSIKAEIK